MAGHFQSISSAIAQRYNNPNNYLERVFAPWPQRLKACAPTPVGSMLHSLFTQAKGSLQSFGWLHSQMIGHWPQPDGQTGPYNTTQLFDEACDFVRSRPDAPAGSAIARSLADLTERKLVPDDRAGRLGEICCLMWPHWPDEIGPLLERLAPALQPQQVASLIGGLDLSSEKSMGFLDALPKILPSASSELATTVFESKATLDSLFDSQDSRVVLSEALLTIIPSATTRDVKVRAAKWARELGGQGVLKKVVDSGVLQKEDLEILHESFPQDRSVKRALRAFENDGLTGL